MRKLLFVCLGMLICSPASAVMVTFNPDDTTYIQGNNGANQVANFGSSTALSADQNSFTRILIRDTSIFPTVPLGATIDSAVLDLNLTNASVDGATISVHRVITGWDEDVVTWNSFNGGGVAGTDYVATPGATFEPGTTSPVVNSVDIASIVQAWSNGAANEGVILLIDNDNGVRYDSDDTITGTAPKLTVNFNTAVIPEPSAFLLLGLVACGFGARKFSWKKN